MLGRNVRGMGLCTSVLPCLTPDFDAELESVSSVMDERSLSASTFICARDFGRCVAMAEVGPWLPVKWRRGPIGTTMDNAPGKYNT